MPSNRTGDRPQLHPLRRNLDTDADLIAGPLKLSHSLERYALGAVPIAPRSQHFAAQGDRMLPPLNLEDAPGLELAIVDSADLLAAKEDLGMALDVEEISGAQILISLGLSGIDAGGLDHALGGGVRPTHEAALEFQEPSGNRRDQRLHVANLKRDGGVHRINRPGSGGNDGVC
jgi:hypothetical protein